MSDILGFMFKCMKPFLGEFKIEVDRQAKKVTIRKADEVRTLTYDEVIDEIERIFGDEQ